MISRKTQGKLQESERKNDALFKALGIVPPPHQSDYDVGISDVGSQHFLPRCQDCLSKRIFAGRRLCGRFFAAECCAGVHTSGLR